MKKVTLLTLAFIALLSFSALAQEESADEQQDTVPTDLSYIQGDKILQGGISLGYYGYGYIGSRTGFTLPLSASFEYGVSKDISAGPFLGFARWSYDYLDYSYSWTFTTVGVRGSFHYLPYLNEIMETEIDASKFDFYLTLLLGLEFRNYSTSYEDYTDRYDNDVNGVFGPLLGFKYYFNPTFSAFVEGGRGVFGYGKIGVSMKF
jgi:hypothetical protein